MCGICGFISRRGITREQLIQMNDTLAHRGPDDGGAELYEGAGGYTVGLAQRRLSIRDLSPRGHQPMHAANGRITIVYNGEIYNTEELREELKDYPFQSTCDTEVILAAYLRWGEELPEHLSGMFAYALYDRERQIVLFARDRIGKKPLYYYLTDEELIFGSELKPIMESPGFSGTIDRTILPRYLYQQYIHAPETIFEGVKQLEPGACLVLHLGEGALCPEGRKYWDLAERYRELAASPVTDYAEAKAELKKLLTAAVKDRLIADVPLGLFLSGGYDSSLMAAIAQEVSDTPVRTFAVGFEEREFDESGAAEAVAKHLGTKHTTRIIGEQDMFALVESLPRFYDEPFADPSQIPTMLVSETAKQDVTVALSGDGGDEFFCGYNIYDNVAQAQKLDLAGAVAHALGRIPLGGGRTLYDRYPMRVQVVADNRDPLTKTQIGSLSYLRAAMEMMGVRVGNNKNHSLSYHMISNDNIKYRSLLNRGAEEGGAKGDKYQQLSYRPLSIKYPMEDRYATSDWQIRRMLLDMETYLPDDILVKVDRASMKVALEARCPILDTRVMEYSFRLPHRFKYQNGKKKYILKDLAYDYIPRELLDRPKQGFSAPIDRWLRGPLKEELSEYSNGRYLKNQGIFDPGYVSAFVAEYLSQGDRGRGSGRNPSGVVWAFFVFQKWEKLWCHR